MAFGYLVPALVVFGVFVFWPLVKSILLSVQGTDIIGNPSGFVGFVNYTRLFTDPEFLQVLWVTFAFTVLTVFPSIALALLVALLLQGRIRGIRFFRTAFALPFAFSVATASVIFGVLYNPASGVLNGLLSYIGVDKVQWLTDPDLAIWSVAGRHGVDAARLQPARHLGGARRPARGRARGGPPRRRLRVCGCSAPSSCR